MSKSSSPALGRFLALDVLSMLIGKEIDLEGLEETHPRHRGKGVWESCFCFLSLSPSLHNTSPAGCD